MVEPQTGWREVGVWDGMQFGFVRSDYVMDGIVVPNPELECGGLNIWYKY
jgi:hypothetical protein